jgi:hypothetical protein
MSDLLRELRIVVRPYATALPLGVFSFGVGWLILAGLGKGWLSPAEQHTAGPLLAAFVFPLEAIATVFAFLARDAFVATGRGLFSSSWLAIGLAEPTGTAGAPSQAVGLFYLLGFSLTIGCLAVSAFLGEPVIGILLLLLRGSGSHSSPRRLTAASSFCSRTCGRRVLPVFRRGSSHEAVERDSIGSPTWPACGRRSSRPCLGRRHPSTPAATPADRRRRGAERRRGAPLRRTAPGSAEVRTRRASESDEECPHGRPRSAPPGLSAS